MSNLEPGIGGRKKQDAVSKTAPGLTGAQVLQSAIRILADTNYPIEDRRKADGVIRDIKITKENVQGLLDFLSTPSKDLKAQKVNISRNLLVQNIVHIAEPDVYPQVINKFSSLLIDKDDPIAVKYRQNITLALSSFSSATWSDPIFSTKDRVVLDEATNMAWENLVRVYNYVKENSRRDKSDIIYSMYQLDSERFASWVGDSRGFDLEESVFSGSKDVRLALSLSSQIDITIVARLRASLDSRGDLPIGFAASYFDTLLIDPEIGDIYRILGDDLEVGKDLLAEKDESEYFESGRQKLAYKYSDRLKSPEFIFLFRKAITVFNEIRVSQIINGETEMSDETRVAFRTLLAIIETRRLGSDSLKGYPNLLLDTHTRYFSRIERKIHPLVIIEAIYYLITDKKSSTHAGIIAYARASDLWKSLNGRRNRITQRIEAFFESTEDGEFSRHRRMYRKLKSL